MRTSKNFTTLVAGALLLAGGQALAADALPVSINLGLNGSHVSDSDKNCFGGQGGLTLGSTVMVRLQGARLSYEQDDDTDSCDGVISGDAYATENALLAGFALGRSGLFVAGGPSRVDFERTEFGPWGTDTGSRIEIGWSSRLAHRSPVGVELVAFSTDTDVRDYHGLGVNVSFGPRSLERPRPARGGRY
jgi:hypothetical protein